MLGNYPQDFSHLGLVLAAQAVATASRATTGNTRKEDPMTDPSSQQVTTTHDLRGGGRPRLIFSHDEHAPAGSPGREFALLPGVTFIGSAADADLPLAGLDERHAEIRRDAADEYTYVHVGTRSGSTVDGRPVGQKVLRTGDRIELGGRILAFYREEFADHGRPHGGRLGGEGSRQRPQEEPRPRGTSADGGSERHGTDPGEYY